MYQSARDCLVLCCNELLFGVQESAELEGSFSCNLDCKLPFGANSDTKSCS